MYLLDDKEAKKRAKIELVDKIRDYIVHGFNRKINLKGNIRIMNKLKRNFIMSTALLLILGPCTPVRAEDSSIQNSRTETAYVTPSSMDVVRRPGNWQLARGITDSYTYSAPTGFSGNCEDAHNIIENNTVVQQAYTTHMGTSGTRHRGFYSADGWVFSVDDAPFTVTGSRHGWVVTSVSGSTAYLRLQFQITNGPDANGPWVSVMERTARVEDVYGERYASTVGSIWVNQNVKWERTTLENITIHYAPVVQGVRPSPWQKTNDNCVGEISGIFNTRSVVLGAALELSPPYTITGGLHGRSLGYVSSSTTTATDKYTATRNIAGVVGISDGSSYNRIGSGNIAWSVRDYQADITNFIEQIIVTTTGAPNTSIWLNYDNSVYTGQWMSNDDSADIARKSGLDIQANSNINGNYDLATLIDFDESGNKIIEASTEVDREVTDTADVTNDMIVAWKNQDASSNNQNTSLNGAPVSSIANKKGDPDTPLSAESTPKYIYFDSTKPTLTTVTTTDDWATITTNAADGLSGLYDNKGVYFKFVPTGQTTDITTPTDGSDWIPIADYEATFAALAEGEYDLYVYAKDNATNRSNAILANTDTPIIVGEGPVATITIRKTVVGPKGNADDVFLINLNDNSTNALITSVALKDGETSSTLTLDIGSATSKTIKLSEIIPMDYKSGFNYNVTKKAGDQTTISGNNITIFPGDTIRIEVENTFEPTGYFKAKDFVKNIFKS